MNLLLDKIKKLNFGWNDRQLTEDDFYRLCKKFRIKVVEMPLRTNGFYYRALGKDFIAIDSRLCGAAKLAVLFHELGHFLFHTPDSGVTANFHGVGRRTRKEIEADVFALCALIPRAFLESRSSNELVDDDGFPIEMVAERFAILERYGL